MAVTTNPLTGVFDADRTHSSFQFAVRHMKVATFRASFRDVDARLIADASELRLEGAARVESISIADPPEFREHVVRGADFFDADNHPEILFRSERVDLTENGAATVEGELTIKGLSRPITATGTWERPVEDTFGSLRAALELRAPRPARLGADLADAASRRRRRARLGRRTHRPARTRQTALAVRLVAASGSLRRGSYNRMLLEAAARELPRGVAFEFLSGLEDLPHYSEDADVEPAHRAVRRLRAALGAADAVLISTPEYNASLPGALKNALARASSAPSGRRRSCAKC
jgi:polyisoprenoid-binding protein YceI